ncbi:MAG: ferredoxin domain-containing protein [Methanohalobium sp.]|uniref:ferredoxin domain-containing protein n=1 Tax=Methanohalobium sp. TaxID=2837493 RepID=UPI00397E8F84
MKLNPESEYIDIFAREILTAARTAPKAKGQDDLITALLDESDTEKLAVAMEEIADTRNEKFQFFKRDAKNVRDSDSVILIGLKSSKALNLDCGACGFDTCADMLQYIQEGTSGTSDFTGPRCSIKFVDLGIAVGAATAKAKDLCIDNRVMYTIGVAAKNSGLIDADMVYGLPLSIKGRNIYFDRK